MTNAVVALGNTEWEPAFISALGHPMLNISVQRRCLDAVDVRSAIRLLDVEAVLLSDATLRVTEDCIDDFRACNIQVIAMSNDPQWWNSIGVDYVIAIDAENVGASIHALALMLRDQQPEVIVHAASHADVVAVTGFGGASGRTTVARELAYVSAITESRLTLLVDADVVCPSLAIELDDDDASRGLLQVVRLAEKRKLDVDSLAPQLTPVFENLSLIRGLPAAGRWSDLRAHALDEMWTFLAEHGESIVIDAGPFLEGESADSAGGIYLRRAAAHASAIDASSHVVLTARADNVGIARLVRGYLDNEEVLNSKDLSVLLTHGNDLSKQAIQSVQRLTGIQSVTVVKSSPAFSKATREHSFASTFDREISETFRAFFCETQKLARAESGLQRQRAFLKGIRRSRAA